MKQFLRLSFSLITIIICIAIDQTTKMLAEYHLHGHASVAFLYRTIYFVYAENTGVVLGIGSGLPENIRFLLFVVFAGIVLIAAIVFVLVKPLQSVTVLAISLVVGGGISNLIDRLIRNGSVVDFMVIKLGSHESGIFNLADVAITLGMCILCLRIYQLKR